MRQSKRGSFIEAWANVFIGYGINFTANALILPQFGFHITLAQNLQIGILFTVISVARSYIIRRWFNKHIARWAERLA